MDGVHGCSISLDLVVIRTIVAKSKSLTRIDVPEVLLHAQERAAGGREVALGDALLELVYERARALEQRGLEARRRGGDVHTSRPRVIGILSTGDQPISFHDGEDAAQRGFVLQRRLA